MISKTNCTLLDNEKPVFNENICEPTEFEMSAMNHARFARCAARQNYQPSLRE